MKKFISILLPSFLVVLFIAVALVLLTPNHSGDTGYTGKIKLSRDDVRIGDIQKLFDSLDEQQTMNYNSFKDITAVNKYFGTNFIDPKTCYYFTSIENGSGFVLATRLESKINIEKYSNDFFIKKKPESYNLNKDILNDIGAVTSGICKFIN